MERVGSEASLGEQIVVGKEGGRVGKGMQKRKVDVCLEHAFAIRVPDSCLCMQSARMFAVAHVIGCLSLTRHVQKKKKGSLCS